MGITRKWESRGELRYVMSAKMYVWLWSVNALIAFTLVFWAFGRGIGPLFTIVNAINGPDSLVVKQGCMRVRAVKHEERLWSARFNPWD